MSYLIFFNTYLKAIFRLDVSKALKVQAAMAKSIVKCLSTLVS